MKRKKNKSKRKGKKDGILSTLKKRAFLVGCGTYYYKYNLPQCVKEAKLMGETCKKAGYETQTYKNLSISEFVKKFENFQKIVGDGDTILIYLSGHGAMCEGKQSFCFSDGNYVVFEDILNSLERRASNLKIISILDCCRVEKDIKVEKYFSSKTITKEEEEKRRQLAGNGEICVMYPLRFWKRVLWKSFQMFD